MEQATIKALENKEASLQHDVRGRNIRYIAEQSGLKLDNKQDMFEN